MTETADGIAPQDLPLCVDLDGTLIRTDVLQESILAYVRRNPLNIFPILFWFLLRGRAHLKWQLGQRVSLDPTTLPYQRGCLAYLQGEKERGRPIYLVTAADGAMAAPIIQHVGLFDGLMASNGVTNLRGSAKAKALIDRFGHRGFVYMGNSTVDLPVWRDSAQVICVNTPPAVITQAAQNRPSTDIQILDAYTSPWSILPEMGLMRHVGDLFFVFAPFPLAMMVHHIPMEDLPWFQGAVLGLSSLWATIAGYLGRDLYHLTQDRQLAMPSPLGLGTFPLSWAMVGVGIFGLSSLIMTGFIHPALMITILPIPFCSRGLSILWRLVGGGFLALVG